MNRRDLWLSLGCGALLALAFPPLKLGFLAFFALIPLFHLLEGKGLVNALRWGYIAGIFFNSGTLYWIAWDTARGVALIVGATVVAILFLSLYFALFALALNFVVKKLGPPGLFSAPFLWTAIEYLRSFGELAFPWTFIGHTQTYYPSYIQFASYTGVYGVSFWIVLLNGVLYFLLKAKGNFRRWWLYLVATLALFLVPYLYGRSAVPQGPVDGEVKTALLQGNIDIETKWDRRYLGYNFEVYREMSLEVAEEGPDLIIWPETAMPFYLLHRPEYRGLVHSLADSSGIPILTGAPHYRYSGGKDPLYYNSAFLFKPGRRESEEYSKIHLVPFGERTPFVDSFPIFSRLNVGGRDFSPGTEYTLFHIPQGEFGVLICFESIFPQLVRRFVVDGADFLVNITNDAWFGRTSSPYQHAQIAVFRAVENRIGIARCANTGVSMIIDPYGRIKENTDIFVRQNLIGNVSLRKTETFYTRHGDLFSKLCLGVALGWLAWALVRRRWSRVQI